MHVALSAYQGEAVSGNAWVLPEKVVDNLVYHGALSEGEGRIVARVEYCRMEDLYGDGEVRDALLRRESDLGFCLGERG